MKLTSEYGFTREKTAKKTLLKIVPVSKISLARQVFKARAQTTWGGKEVESPSDPALKMNNNR